MAGGQNLLHGFKYICLKKKLSVETKDPGETTVTRVSKCNTLIGPPGAEVVVVVVVVGADMGWAYSPIPIPFESWVPR